MFRKVFAELLYQNKATFPRKYSSSYSCIEKRPKRPEQSTYRHISLSHMECWIIAAMQCFGLELNLQGEAGCSRSKGHGDRVLHSKPFCPTHTVHFNCSWFLSLFQSPQAASPFIFLNSLPFSGSHLLCLSRKCLLLCLNLKKKQTHNIFFQFFWRAVHTLGCCSQWALSLSP